MTIGEALRLLEKAVPDLDEELPEGWVCLGARFRQISEEALEVDVMGMQQELSDA